MVHIGRLLCITSANEAPQLIGMPESVILRHLFLSLTDLTGLVAQLIDDIKDYIVGDWMEDDWVSLDWIGVR